MRTLRAVALALSIVLAVSAGACSKQSGQQPQRNYAGAFLYGSDGNTINGFAKGFENEPGILSGMKGTAPMVQLSAEFISRLKRIDPGLKDLLFAGETYDAVVISAIAAQVAGTTDPRQIAKQINGVTIGADPCSTVAACLELARIGKDPAYRGITVRNGFTPAGEPSTATYGTFHFGADNLLDEDKTEFLNAGNENSATKERAPRPSGSAAKNTGPLVLGGLLPVTGGLSFAYPPMIAGARLAIKEINEAGGVFGKDVVWHDGDDYTDPQKSLATIAKHKADGVQVIIGPSASGITVAVLPEVVKAGMVLFSPSNTAESLSTADDQGLYFRTAPSDILQARALADVVLRDGARTVCIVARGDAYGEGLMAGVAKELTAAGLSAGSIRTFRYDLGTGGMVKDPNQVNEFARQIGEQQPDGVVVIGFEESADVIKALAKAGFKFRH
jgi:ABC-type branched-subunit amino acid transport system substrate-binding protein